MEAISSTATTDFLAEGGELGALMRGHDWSMSPLGPPAHWPQSLKTAVRIMLNSRYPMFVWWGEERINLYNDAYVSVLGQRHPWALGRPAREVWYEIWDLVGAQSDLILKEGKASWHDKVLLIMERNGYPEETYFTFSHSPIPDDDGGIGGVFCACTEDTAQIVGQRRLKMLRQLVERTAEEAKTAEDVCNIAATILAEYPNDIHCALLYLLDEDERQAQLAASTRLTAGGPASPAVIALDDGDATWPLRTVLDTRKPQTVDCLPERFGVLPGGAWPESPTQAWILPLAKPGQKRLAGFLIAAVSPRLPFNDDYQGLLELTAGHIATAIGNARAHEAERRRADALADIDRAKTAFFSNISHEFRTPLTLILGPAEEMLGGRAGTLSETQRERIQTLRRNAMRLQRLVNALLDFARVEAERAEACYAPVDLATFTRELASAFTSAIDRAGLRLTLDCPPLGQPIYVDRDMWEKIVLNLVSNAFKFTFEGGITVSLRLADGRAMLRVEDTGIGIAPDELPRVFERFHRVPGVRARTHEGSGIGLALVQELVRLHGGTLHVDSELGKGSVFTVSLPTGFAHLPKERISALRSLPSTANGTAPYVEEALRWLPDRPDTHDMPTTSHGAAASRERILIVDDNADMRAYLRRLLEPRWAIETASDGGEALEAVLAAPPALVISDIMMPGTDGLELVRTLRADPLTASIPVILLSARTGEEAQVSAMRAGADDYIVKPFSVRELLARVTTRLEIARVRRESTRRITSILESIGDELQMIDGGWRYTYFNAAARRALTAQGIDAQALLGKHIFDEAFPGLREQETGRAISRAMHERAAIDVETYDEARKRWHYARVYPMPEDGVAIFVQDITARKRTEVALRDSEERMRLAMEAANVFTWEVDVATREITYSANVEKVLGFTLKPRAKDNALLVHPEDRDAIREQYHRALQGEQNYDVEYRFVNPHSGDIVWVRVQGHLTCDVQAKKARFLGISQNITERKRTEARYAFLLLLEDSMRAITRPSEICETAVRLLCKELNADRVIYAEVAPDQNTCMVIGEHPMLSQTAAVHHLADFGDNLHQQLVTGKPVTSHGVAGKACPALCAGQGNEFTGVVAYVAMPLCKSRELAAVLAVFQAWPRHWRNDEIELIQLVANRCWESVERARVSRELQESEARFRSMANSSPTMIWVTDADGRIEFVNQAFLDFFRITHEQAPAFDWAATIHPDDVEAYVSAFKAAIREVKPFNMRARVRRADGQWRWLESYANPRLDALGRVTGCVGTSPDLTDIYTAQEALKHADRRKDEFLATLAHELRNPLAPIRNALHILRHPGGTTNAAQVLDMMERQTDHMVRLVDDLMEVSRITRGQIALRKAPVGLATILHNALETSRPLIEQAGQKLVLSLPNEPLTLHADAMRLAQIFSNLLNNASKYTEEAGQIWLSAHKENDKAVVSIRDNGIGIPPESLPHVFDMFTQVNRGLERAQGGLGIGLALVRSLVQMHGGTVEARSDGLGKGSEFVVRLPLATERTPYVTRTDQSSPDMFLSYRILVVDDNRDVADSLGILLRLLGAKTHVVHDGPAALAAIETFKPSVVLLDLGMPGMSGYEVARRIRRQYSAQDITLIALTGWGQDEDRRRARLMGFDYHLTKPADIKSLQECLSHLQHP